MKFPAESETAESALCRMCRVENDAVSHIVRGCQMLAQREYKREHSNVCRYAKEAIHWRLCEKHSFEGVS